MVEAGVSATAVYTEVTFGMAWGPNYSTKHGSITTNATANLLKKEPDYDNK